MSVEAILTVITVVLAVLAIIPPERSQDLRIRLGGSAILVVKVAAGLVLYWSLLEPMHAFPWLDRTPRVIPWLDGWDPASSSLAILLVATGYCLWTYGKQIPVGRLQQLASVLADALARRRFAECAHLLEAHREAIRNGLNGSFWRSMVRRRLFPTAAELHLRALKSPRPDIGASSTDYTSIETSAVSGSTGRVISIPAPLKPSRFIQQLVDWAERPTNAAHDIVRMISLAPELVRHIATTNPYLGLSLSQLPSTWLVREFSETFARALIADRESIIYRELRRAENLDTNNVPRVDRVEQPLLSALCDDAVHPDGPRMLYTYLDAGIDALRGGAGRALRDELNQPLGDFFERTRWFSPPFATVYLLEVTALRNAVSGEAQNLNLYVTRTLVDTLLQELRPTAEVNLTREWPTPTHYLLYECVSLLVDLVVIWRDRPADLPAKKLAEVDEGLPRILSAHAIDVLASVMYELLQSKKLDAKFKGYILEVWWRAYWPKYKSAWAYSGAILERLVRGGGLQGSDMKHRDGLEEALEHVDIMIQIGEGGADLRAAFGLPPR